MASLHRSAVLAEADRLITGDRAEAYGDASVSFGRIAALWSAYLGSPVKPHDAAVMLALLKVSRIAGGPRPDDFVDGVGYLALGGEIASR